MKTLLPLFLSLIFLPPLFSQQLQWPAKQTRQISSVFGESRKDHFHAGVDIPGEDWSVLPLADGETLFRISARNTPGKIPFGGGNTVLLEHDSLWSGYMHLNSFSGEVLQQEPKAISKSTALGTAGNTGHSGGAHLHFFVYSRERRKVYNPLPLLSQEYSRDAKAPQVKSFALILDEKLVQVNPGSQFRMTQDYPLYVFLQDSGMGGERWGIYELKVKRGNEVVQEFKFDAIELKDGQWVTLSGKPFSKVFRDRYYLLGEDFRNHPNFTIEARGFFGPAVTKNYNLDIIRN